MNIVVVDHVFLSDEHVRRLEKLGNLKVFKEPPKTTDELRRRIRDADVAIVGWSHVTRDIIESAERLKMISIWATTCHYVDHQAAKEKGVIVTHVPGYASEAVAEHTFALLLAAIRRLPAADKHVREGLFDWRPFAGRELAGKRLGVVGTGAIGFRVAELGKAFGMKIIGHDKYPNPKKAAVIGLKYVDLPTLLKESDVISLHVTLTSETECMIGRKEVALMKQGVVIVNTSQGKVFDEKTVAEALKSGRVSFAGLDVFAEEPPARDNLLLRLDNVVLSPHVGFHTVEAAKRCTDICIDNVAKFVKGQVQNAC